MEKFNYKLNFIGCYLPLHYSFSASFIHLQLRHFLAFPSFFFLHSSMVAISANELGFYLFRTSDQRPCGFSSRHLIVFCYHTHVSVISIAPLRFASISFISSRFFTLFSRFRFFHFDSDFIRSVYDFFHFDSDFIRFVCDFFHSDSDFIHSFHFDFFHSSYLLFHTSFGSFSRVSSILRFSSNFVSEILQLALIFVSPCYLRLSSVSFTS